MQNEIDIFNKIRNCIEESKCIWTQKKKFLKFIICSTPLHGNLGDHLITIAEKQWLKETYKEGICTEIPTIFMSGKYRVLLGNFKPYIRKARVLFINGGGFMGSLWPNEEKCIRKLIKFCPNKQIIVFPQTVYYDMNTEKGKKEYEISRNIFSAHKNLTVCVRENNSLQFMKTYFSGVKCILLPDMVMIMQYKGKTAEERKRVLLCFRQDKEKIYSDDVKSRIIKTVENEMKGEKLDFIDTVSDRTWIGQNKREKYVYDLLEQFSTAKLIVTDRLHGMLFSLITGTPCIAFDNMSRKVEGVYEWIKDIPYIQFCHTEEDVERSLKQLDLNKTWHYNPEDMRKKFDILKKLVDGING